MNLKDITVTVLAKNSEKYLREMLTSLASFGEVVLYDTGSTDGTLEIGQSFPNVRIFRADFVGFGPTHNIASACASNNWIFSIDSDEIASAELIETLSTIKLDEKAVYSFPRHNYFNGKFIKWCGWYPDRQVRLYNKTKTKFSDDQVHEAIISENMRHVYLQAPIIHYSYGTVADFLGKMQSYSTLFANQNRGKKSSSLFKAISHGCFAFFKGYFLKRGFLGGYEGFLISAYNGHTAYYKYLKLYEANKELSMGKK